MINISKWQKNIAYITILVFIFTITLVSSNLALASQKEFNDIQGHWASETIQQMANLGIISGNPDGTFIPEGQVTRAEFATMLVKTYKLSGSGKLFSDTTSHWAKDYIAMAHANGIVNGYNANNFGPNDPITREQMAVMVVKAAKLQNTASGKTFADSQNISDWAKDAVTTATENNIITGYPDNRFKPKGNATRAEAVVVLNKSINIELVVPPQKEEPIKPDYSLIEKAGNYGPKTGTETVLGNITVKAKDTTLQNLIIKGDLIIAKEVGNGDVILDNITVTGKTYIRGGGKNSIHINGGKYNEIIIEKTATGSVRIVAVNNQGIIVTIAENASGEEIILNGDIKSVTVKADDVKITTQGETTIGELNVASGLNDVNIELAKNSTIKEMILDSKVAVQGEGTIKKASGSKVKEVNFPRTPDKIVAPSTGGGGSSSGAVAVTGVSLDETKITLQTSYFKTIEATVLPSNASNKKVTWKSSDESVATVDADGLVKAKSVGTTIITVTTEDGNKNASCTCTVEYADFTLDYIKIKGVDLEGFSPTKGTYTYWIESGNAISLDDVTVKAKGEADIAITFNNNKDVISIDVKAKKGGFATYNIYLQEKPLPVTKTALTNAISTANINKTTVSVSTKNGIDVQPDTKWVTQEVMIAYENAIATAQAIVDKATATQKEVDDAELALGGATSTFDNAKKDGLKPIAVTGVTLDQESLTILMGSTQVVLTATVSPANANNTGLSWSSSKNDIVSIENVGVAGKVGIRPLAIGETTINVKTSDGGFEANCVVTVSSSGTITGKVTSNGATVIQDVIVQLFNTENNEIKRVNTNKNGEYTITGIPAGTYRLKYSKNQHEDYVINDVIITADGETLTHDITMISDKTAPTVAITPANGATDVSVKPQIILTFSELVRKAPNGAEINGTNATSCISLKDSTSNNVLWTATGGKEGEQTIITFTPSQLAPNQSYTISIGAEVLEDLMGNKLGAVSSSFTTGEKI